MNELQKDIKERTFEFAIALILFCKKLRKDNNEFILSKQLIRSSTSVGANIREAKNAESKADFIHKMGIAQKEIDESIYWLDLIAATEEIDIKEIETLKSEAVQLLKIVRTIILNTKKNLHNS